HIGWAVSNAPVSGGCRITIYPYPGASSRGLGPCLIGRGDVKTGDFNNDGQLDVAVGNAGGEGTATHGVAGLVCDGRGHLDPPRTFAVGRYPRSITVGDFNNDQNLDLAIVGNDVTDRSIYILLGDGTGDFAVSRLDAQMGAPFIVSGDFNEDGFLD